MLETATVLGNQMLGIVFLTYMLPCISLCVAWLQTSVC